MNSEPIPDCYDKLSEALALFPINPRGHLQSRSDAIKLANEIIESAIDKDAAVQKAVKALERMAFENGYTEPVKDGRMKLRYTKPFVYDVDDEETPLIMTRLVENQGKSGQGNKTNIERISIFAHCFIEFRNAGLPLPIERIYQDHMRFESFVEALAEAEHLADAGIKKTDAGIATDEQLQKLRKVARHTLIQAGKAFSDK